jgi:SMC interacting uncharacterized protein involved in chromosome segregation
MRDINSLKKECIDELNSDREYKLKEEIKRTIQNIICLQEQMQNIANKIAEEQKFLKDLSLPITITEQMV